MIHIPDRIFEGYGPNVEAIRALAERGATLLVTVDCGTTSIEPLAEARRLGLDVDRDRPPSGRRDAAATRCVVNPNRLDDLSELGHLAAVGLVFLTVVAVNRVLRARGFWTTARPEPDLLGVARSRRARHRRRRGAAQGPQPRLRRQGPDRAAPPRQRRPHRADGRGAARPARRSRGISASCSGRASMPAAASAAPTSARGCCCSDDPIEAGAHRRRARPPQPRAPGDRAGDAGGGRSRGAWPRSASRRRARWWSPRRRRLASRRGRAGRGAAQGALRPAGLRHRARARRHRHRLGPLDPRRRSRPRGAPRGGATACCSRAAATPWRRASRCSTDALAAFRAYLEDDARPRRSTAARRDHALLIDGAVSAAGANAALIATLARAGPFGAGNPEPVIALPATPSPMPTRSAQAHVRARLQSGRRRDGQRHRVPRARPAARPGADEQPRAARSMPPARCRSTAGTAPSGCSCGSVDVASTDTLASGDRMSESLPIGHRSPRRIINGQSPGGDRLWPSSISPSRSATTTATVR